ncbi:MAG: cadmium-translocating P-type ATPase [Candidatus Melainabacteria bacterium]|nr:MAG: cadmium-translocating P-type ATPase [Candidatus Melainabacteria bacterium]
MCEHCCHNKVSKTPIILFLITFILGFRYEFLFFVSYVIVGWEVLWKAFKNIIKGEVFDENFLMGIATIGALCIGEVVEAVMVMVLYQIGEYLQDRAVDSSRDSISKLMDIRPDYANLDGKKVSPEVVKIGDIITVNTGEKIPLDGTITEGFASIDTSALTGESIPKKVKVGDDVISGCINKDGVLKVKVTKIFTESTVSKILDLVENASSKKAKTTNFITKFAKIYTPTVVVLALIMAFIPPAIFNQAFTPWIQRALTFLVISCPCALVISIPLSFFAGIGGASKEGILVKGSNYIEALSKASAVIFDKTGTLTKGSFKVTEISSNYPDFLKYAAYAESASSHPIAEAIRKEYGKDIPQQSNIQEIAGMGIRALVDGKEVLIGNEKLVKTTPVNKVGTVVYVSIDGNMEGYIVISDEIKEDSFEAIDKLKKSGIYTEMLTGDSIQVAEEIGNVLELDKIYAELLPENKVEKLEEVMNNSRGCVLFVGDGINDAPVLTRADVGIAMGALGSDAAIEAADVVIMDDKPSKVVTAIKSAKKTMTIVKENIIFAIGVKGLFLILGGFGFVSMWGAVFADVGVSLIAIINALRAIKVKK